ADFIKLVLIAVVIASPIAWWAMNKWLEDFAYRVDIQWWMFAGAGIIAVFIALFTVSFQAVKAAVAHPVDSLRDEYKGSDFCLSLNENVPSPRYKKIVYSQPEASVDAPVCRWRRQYCRHTFSRCSHHQCDGAIRLLFRSVY